MKKTALTLLTGAALLLAGSAFAREVKVGTECTNPPFNYRTAGGELTGFDVDLAREIGKRAGFELQFVCQAFEGLIPALSARKFDLILASLSITEARQQSIDFSSPYRASTGRFVGPKGSKLEPVTADGKPNPKALDGLWSYQDFINGFFEDKQGKDFAFVGPELESIKYFGPGVGVGLRKNEPELLAKVDEALKGMFADGTFKAINRKYWKFTVMPSVWNG